MSVEQSVLERSAHACELCGSTDAVGVMLVSPKTLSTVDDSIAVCAACQGAMDESTLDAQRWRCLTDSMWSPVPAVQVVVYRLLKRLDSESWAQDALDMLYLDDDTRKWAEQGVQAANVEATVDVNGAVLQAGDNVVLIKDLDVKGANFTAKRGTAVRGISLSDNPKHIEGRVNGQRIVIISAYVKKS